MKNNGLKGKIIWITGSGRGIGKATALALAEHGAGIILSARTKSEIKGVARKVNLKSQALAIQCDVSDRKQVSDAINKIKSKWGAVDILVNNAGRGIFKKIIDTTEEDWNELMNANLKSAFLCSQAVLPDMIKRKTGHIINIVSVAGRQPYYNCGGYCASKYGMLGFTDVLRLETRKYGIKVTAFLPGATDTDIWGDANIDRSKMMTPEQVAKGIIAICCGDKECMMEEVVLRPISGDLS